MTPVSFGLDWIKSPCLNCPNVDEDKCSCQLDCDVIKQFRVALDSHYHGPRQALDMEYDYTFVF